MLSQTSSSSTACRWTPHGITAHSSSPIGRTVSRGFKNSTTALLTQSRKASFGSKPCPNRYALGCNFPVRGRMPDSWLAAAAADIEEMDYDLDLVIEVYDDAEEVAEALCEAVMVSADIALSKRGAFTLAIPGGSVAKALGDLANSGKADIDWEKVYLFFVNERLEGKNYKLAKEVFLDKVGIPESQVFTVSDTDPDTEAAKYEESLLSLPEEVMPRAPSGLPRFDLVLLGAGADGHVGSIYPNSAEAEADGCILAVNRPDKKSITFSLPLLNAAEQVVVAATGAGKAEMVQTALEDPNVGIELPAGCVRCNEKGTVVWMLDQGSSGKLEPDDDDFSDYTEEDSG
ncbi:hypothetical protein CYMTET_24648 [Cymbomonas tetramitiformis]|uniref:Glucosamine/galactosamine-6-phosphate isomerase domain-containing protein n=1 Tax=Cymbomonas tetramitiformis TaxID=36881 RepID=A0AAE0FVM1_9CHLO|nr:hypothetical protein CYMTET_24648 [Cymbomonas tetramitiformis]